MKKLPTPRGLPWTQDRVTSFRTNRRFKKGAAASDPDVLNCKQAREYLGISWNGLNGLVRRGMLDTNQVADFAPWRLSRADLDSDVVLKTGGHPQGDRPPPAEGGVRRKPAAAFPSEINQPMKGCIVMQDGEYL